MVNSYFGFIAAFGFGGVDGFFVQSCMYLSTLFQICREDAKLAFFAGTCKLRILHKIKPK